MGDAHASQGDSEFDGTAIETSINAKLKLTLHKKGKLPKKVQGLDFPLLENANEYIVHGYAIKVRYSLPVLLPVAGVCRGCTMVLSWFSVQELSMHALLLFATGLAAAVLPNN